MLFPHGEIDHPDAVHVKRRHVVADRFLGIRQYRQNDHPERPTDSQPGFRKCIEIGADIVDFFNHASE
jgi:hypothetical protein